MIASHPIQLHTLGSALVLLKYKLEIVKIYRELVDRIDKSVMRVTVWYHKGDAKQYLRDRFVNPFLKLMSWHTFGCQRLNIFSFILKCSVLTPVILKKTYIVVTSLND